MGNGYLSDLIEGIEWSITNKMDIINMNLGVQDSISLHDAIIKANQSGIILVAAAGNKAYSSVDYPDAYPEFISVAATDYNDQISPICPRGKIDISAPEVDIYSTYKGGTYNTLTGTSMATPHVTGVVSILLSNPSKVDLNGDGKVTTLEVNQKLQSTAKDLGDLGIDAIYELSTNCVHVVYLTPKLPISISVLQICMPIKYHQRTLTFQVSHKLRNT